MGLLQRLAALSPGGSGGEGEDRTPPQGPVALVLRESPPHPRRHLGARLLAAVSGLHQAVRANLKLSGYQRYNLASSESFPWRPPTKRCSSRCVFRPERAHATFNSFCSDSEQQQAPVLASRVRGRAVGDLRFSSREAAPGERLGGVDSRRNATGLRRKGLLISGTVGARRPNGRVSKMTSGLMDTTGRRESFLSYIHIVCTRDHVAFKPTYLFILFYFLKAEIYSVVGLCVCERECSVSQSSKADSGVE